MSIIKNQSRIFFKNSKKTIKSIITYYEIYNAKALNHIAIVTDIQLTQKI